MKGDVRVVLLWGLPVVLVVSWIFAVASTSRHQLAGALVFFAALVAWLGVIVWPFIENSRPN